MANLINTTEKVNLFPNLYNAIELEHNNRLADFIKAINEVTDIKGLTGWQYTDLLPKGKNVSKMSFADLKAYLITRKEKATIKSLQKELAHLQTVSNAGELLEATITIEWKRSQMWGNNPTAESRIATTNGYEYPTSGSIGGCGYDKESTAVANSLNQCNAILKAFYTIRENNLTVKNHELFGYGSGYGILPRLEGGVGTNCYNAIFDKIGYKFSKTAWGKTFDVYTITKNS